MEDGHCYVWKLRRRYEYVYTNAFNFLVSYNINEGDLRIEKILKKLTWGW